MHYVIIRDDDTNALTPPECLERLYRPLLERGLPVNLAVIPNVATDTRTADGELEGYLTCEAKTAIPEPAQDSVSRFGLSQRRRRLPIATNPELITYLLENPNFHIVQHGSRHEFLEFDRLPPSETGPRLEEGT